MIVIITIIFAIAVGVYMVNHPETWNGSYCINGDCVYKDYGDSAFTSLAIMPLAALIGRCGKCWKYWDSVHPRWCSGLPGRLCGRCDTPKLHIAQNSVIYLLVACKQAYGPVAQLVRAPPVTAEVTGSSPAGVAGM